MFIDTWCLIGLVHLNMNFGDFPFCFSRVLVLGFPDQYPSESMGGRPDYLLHERVQLCRPLRRLQVHAWYMCRPVHPPYSSVFVTEFNPEYGNTDLLIWLRKRSSSKYGNGHHLNIFFTVISCIKNVAPSVGNVHVPLYYARCQATRNIP